MELYLKEIDELIHMCCPEWQLSMSKYVQTQILDIEVRQTMTNYRKNVLGAVPKCVQTIEGVLFEEQYKTKRIQVHKENVTMDYCVKKRFAQAEEFQWCDYVYSNEIKHMA